MLKLIYGFFGKNGGFNTPINDNNSLCNYATISALRASNADILLFTAASAMIS